MTDVTETTRLVAHQGVTAPAGFRATAWTPPLCERGSSIQLGAGSGGSMVPLSRRTPVSESVRSLPG